jgi:beta-aspartyl-peptidase (threonine type)
MRSLSEGDERRYRDGLREACARGAAILEQGGHALDAVTSAIQTMEDLGVFNAGLGSCLTSAGEIEMDAAVMNGADRGFGAVAGIRGVANPILVARKVMEETRYCILGAEGATNFAREQGLDFREGFPSESRLEDWRRKKASVLAKGGVESGGLAALGGVLGATSVQPRPADEASDTVGACALDGRGGLASAVSTGGLWLKPPGRIGDSPLPGAGLWALDGRGAAVSTGTGETILRTLLCKEVVDRLAGGVQSACAEGIALLEEQFGAGMAGVIAIDARGRPGFALNTRGMGRALWTAEMSESAVAVWPEEDWDRGDAP